MNRTKEKILNEASKQFNEVGYFDTRLGDIADAIGTAKTSVSYHFRSKEALLFEVYQRTCDFSVQAITEAAKESCGLDRVLRYVQIHVEHLSDALARNTAPIAILNDLEGLDHDHQVSVSKRYQEHIHACLEFVKDGVRDGSMNVRSVEAATFFAMNACQWATRWLHEVPDRQRTRALERLFDLLRYGLSVDRQWRQPKRIAQDNRMHSSFMFDRAEQNRMKLVAILRTGIRHLNRNGYRSLSLEQIAAELGVTRGAFYYHIEDKDALLVQCLERTCDLVDEALNQAAAMTDLTSLDRLGVAMRELFYGHITEREPLARLNLIHSLTWPRQAAVQARVQRFRSTLSTILADGMLDGSIRQINIPSLDFVVFGTLAAASARRYAATRLESEWSPEYESVGAATAYLQPLMTGLAAQG